MVEQQDREGTMAVTTTPAAERSAYDEWATRRWVLTGRVLVLLWLVAVVALVAVGERRSDLGALHGGLADGSISEVEVTGLPEGGVQNGFATVRLTWRARVLRHSTEVLVVSSDRTGARLANADDLPVVVGDPVATLERLRPGVVIVRDDYRGGTSWETAGWTLRGTAGSAVLVLGLATFLLLVGGPQPWRATRWAWFWLVLASPLLGCVAYVLLGGPLGLGRPRNPSRRLTGGWAFLIGLLVLGGYGASG